jgi:hypothetical protein
MKTPKCFGNALAALALICGLSVPAHACVTATVGGVWQNTAMTAQTGTFTATFDATPSAAPNNSVVALSDGAQTAYANFSCLVRFNTSGDIDARNGGAFAAASTIPYSAGVSYHFSLVVNVAAQTYSIYVTPAGGSQLTVGLNYAFRIAATTLNWWGVSVETAGTGGAGTVTVCNFSIGGTTTYTITASAGANGSISPSGAVAVNQGASQTFTITPSSGYTVASVTVDSVNMGTMTSYLFSNVQANHTISAAFQQQVVVTPPNFGPNVIIFDPTMSSASIQSQITTIYNQQKSGSTGQFDSSRYALLFKPGSYSNTVDVGYYTQVLGLGQSPDDVIITGGVISNAALSGNNATCNFWEGAENLAVVPSGGTDQWAVSQACPMRRVHIKGSIVLQQGSGYASGGFLCDSLIDNETNFGGQQQWVSRNTQSGSWAGGSWNVVYVGNVNTPGASAVNTVISRTPVSREKPFLTVDSSGNYSVFVPALATNSQGITWSSATPGQSIPISQFYIAQASTDTAATLNAALAQGKNLLLTPGIYSINATLQVNNPNTVVLGLGLATLLSQNGVTTMTVADVDGVTIAGILFDAGSTSSPFQLQVGPTGSSASHAGNPTLLSDLFFRVGGATLGKTAVSLEINSNNVIGDDFWIWRADHGNSGTVGWTTNTANNGLIVNGANVTIYGLAVEHYQQYQTLWNGNGGSVYFYQSEAPYDPPNQASWMAGSEDGYASYKVADTVTSHTGYGIGVYCNFDVNKSVILGNAIEVPTAYLNGAMMHDMVTVSLGGTGTIEHIIDGEGGTVGPGNTQARLAQ